MNNAIKYYYNLNPEEIHQINKTYRFNIKDYNYLFEPFNREVNDAAIIYDLHNYLLYLGYYCHRIVLNKNNQIITNINGINYIMLQVFSENRKINIDDIIYFSNIHIKNKIFSKLERDNWYNLWINKIDYFEYQVNQFSKKYPLIRKSSDYFIGLAENCISLLINIQKDYNIITVSHNRTTTNTSLIDYLDPTNFILDNRIRDISEYLKNCILNQIDIIETIKNYIYYNKLTVYEINLLFIRIFYPSYYFDMCEKIISGNLKEEELNKILKIIDYIEQSIKAVYKEIRMFANVPEIEWLIKK